MKLDKAQSAITASSNDVTMTTKQTSYTEDIKLNWSCTIISNINKPKKKIFTDSPGLKRSQSHKRHHFKVDIRNIVNEEWNEDDSDNNINSINYNQICCADIETSLNISGVESEINSNDNYKYVNMNNTWEEQSLVDYTILPLETEALTNNLTGQCTNYCYNGDICLNKLLFQFENYIDSDEYHENAKINNSNNSKSSTNSWNEGIEDFDLNNSDNDKDEGDKPIDFGYNSFSDESKKRIRRIHLSCKSSPVYSNSDNKSKESNSNKSIDKIQNIPTILGRILKEEALRIDDQ